MNLIFGHCFSNLDDFLSVDWPRSFVAVPRIGERVEGKRGTNLPTLRVVGVTHYSNEDGQPRIRVELHR